jgi:hypothetical protein
MVGDGGLGPSPKLQRKAPVASTPKTHWAASSFKRRFANRSIARQCSRLLTTGKAHGVNEGFIDPPLALHRSGSRAATHVRTLAPVRRHFLHFLRT